MFIMTVIFLPKYYENYKRLILPQERKAASVYQEPGWTIFLVFLSFTGQFATHQNHDAQKELVLLLTLRQRVSLKPRIPIIEDRRGLPFPGLSLTLQVT